VTAAAVVHALQAHGFAFGKSDLFFCCGCRPVGSLDVLKACVSAAGAAAASHLS
jgi:hypothetical protein